jgi:uncharacterized protein
MEEILASIRRIIADEDTGKPKAPAATPAVPATAPAAVAPPPAPKPPQPAIVAARPAPPPAPPKPAPANNQSDIDAMLADIDAKPKAAVLPPPPPVTPAAPDILDLTEAMATPSPTQAGPAAAFRTIDAASDVFFTDAVPERTPPPQPATDYQGLISNATMSAVDSAFNSLAHTVLGNNARTLEDLVKEMLRPMLKGWLDDNLPNMVERIVRAEIERVSRGRS